MVSCRPIRPMSAIPKYLGTYVLPKDIPHVFPTHKRLVIAFVITTHPSQTPAIISHRTPTWAHSTRGVNIKTGPHVLAASIAVMLGSRLCYGSKRSLHMGTLPRSNQHNELPWCGSRSTVTYDHRFIGRSVTPSYSSLVYLDMCLSAGDVIRGRGTRSLWI